MGTNVVPVSIQTRKNVRNVRIVRVITSKAKKAATVRNVLLTTLAIIIRKKAGMERSVRIVRAMSSKVKAATVRSVLLTIHVITRKRGKEDSVRIVRVITNRAKKAVIARNVRALAPIMGVVTIVRREDVLTKEAITLIRVTIRKDKLITRMMHGQTRMSRFA